MQTLICPISGQRISRHVVRLTGLMMSTMIALYLLTGSIAFIMVIVFDYFIRAFTTLPYSPFGWVAMQIVRHVDWAPSQVDKAPKIFAARVGLLFAVGTALLYLVHTPASMIVGAALMTFALLESVFDFCVGCFVYTYIILPLVRD